MVVGWGIDDKTKSLGVDFQVTALPGTSTAEDFARMKEAVTNFAGFALPGTAVAANWSFALDDSDVAQFKSAVAEMHAKTSHALDDNDDLSKDQIRLGKRLLGDVHDVANKTLEHKKVDGALTVALDSGKFTLAFGTILFDGSKLNGVLKDLAAEVRKEDADLGKHFHFDVETHAGVHLHTGAVPVTDEGLSDVLGKSLDIVVGIGDDALYLTAGHQATQTIKQVIDDSQHKAGQKTLSSQVTVTVTPIAKFVAQSKGRSDVGDAIVKILSKAAGKDHVTLAARTIPLGAKVELRGRRRAAHLADGGDGRPGDGAGATRGRPRPCRRLGLVLVAIRPPRAL